ncbi:MarR family transcriptional regulator [Parvibaculum sp.]|uniref:MarR family winged helix-turn-helix transcriptional regulator n=1 Tax=Parvibaculum sp. TaxID=2024848 RepID=UPI001B19D020|nr:MarR family transcriptional regulator [Parvibaculum sp.]MBO6633131.1 MarR family transcriptional regulator [Parvibaculum sp.]MBO6679633.1 MarR family transcriptional regulator [Parvibaculum sp.]MBO6686586.1 MarR family transcriptional regulator [Parvibaculum sp.]MBO6906523.1 MarR family transcriptional regulator [Parvibaculum sp.]
MTKSSPARAEDPLGLDNQLCFALYSSSLLMTKLYKPLLAEIGLTYPQYLVMLSLWEEDGVTVSRLGERLYLDSGTLTPLLKRLEKAGLVTRERNEKDERQVLVRLTPEGKALKRQAAGIPKKVAIASGLSLDEILNLRKRLKKLRGTLAA